MFFKNIFKSKKVKVIRVADEGFNIKPYDKGTTEIFLDVVITDLNQTIIPDQNHALRYKDDKMEGCFCFLEGFDETQFDDNLPFRKGHKWNIGYLLEDELVFVRNTRDNKGFDKFVNEYDTNRINPITEEPLKVRLFHRPYEFIKMPLFLAMERLNRHIELKDGGKPDEEISEIYLTKEQIERTLETKK